MRLPMPRDAAGAVCGAGCAHARGHRGGVRGRHAELRRARRARQPAGASSARARRRPRGRGGALPGALARDGRWPARHPQGRRRLPAARSGLSGASGWPSCSTTPAPPVLVTPAALAGRLPAPAPRATGARAARRRLADHRAQPAPPPPSRSTRTIPPMSSTPQAPPAHRRRRGRASGLADKLAGCADRAFRRRAAARFLHFVSLLRCRDRGDCCCLLSAAALLSCRSRAAGRDALVSSHQRELASRHATLPSGRLSAESAPRTLRSAAIWSWAAKHCTARTIARARSTGSRA